MIEDEKQVFELVKISLKPLGYNVSYMDPAGDVAAELEKGYRVLLTDFLMPQKNGLEIADGIRANEKFKDLPIILLTSKELLPEETKELKRLDMDYLRKPFLAQILSSKIKEVLGRTKR